MRNLFWDLVFIIDAGGLIALVLAAWAKWPNLIRCFDVLLCVAGPGLFVVLAAGFIHARVTEYRNAPGTWIHGVHYENWRNNS